MTLKNIYKAQTNRFNLSSDDGSDNEEDEQESGWYERVSPSHTTGEEPLVPPRRKHKVRHLNGKRKTKSSNFTWIVCFVLFIICIVGVLLILLNILREASISNDSDVNSHSNQVNQSNHESAVKSCNHFTSTEVWHTTIPKLMTETAIRLNDVNKDGVDDILIGFMTALDGYFLNGAPKAACDLYFNGTFPCFGGILALDGLTGKELWRHYTLHEVFAINCNADIDFDGVRDCLIGGRAGVFEAISARAGKMLWRFRKEDAGYEGIMGIYTAQFVRDLDGDGVSDVLAAHGGDPLSEPGSEDRLNGRLILFSGKTGHVLQWKNVPDERETYFSPVVYSLSNGTDIVLFGTGGETHSGALWAIGLIDLYHGLIEKAIIIYSDNYKGVMVPPVLADITNDGTVDIIMAMFNTSVAAFDGETYDTIWQFSFPGSESYVTPAAGYFNDDDIPDFFVRYNHGKGFPSYYYSEVTVLDGKTGKAMVHPYLKSSVMVNTSPFSVSMTGLGNDLFIYWTADCVGHEGEGDWYEFVEGTNVHEQSRADTCQLRYKTKSFSQLSAMNRQTGFPGHAIYNSLKYEHLVHGQTDNVTQKGSRRKRRHVGPPDHGGFQRLIQTGCLAPAHSTKNSQESGNAIDVMIVTYWMYPAKVRVITDKEKDCIDHYRNLSRQGKFENKVDIEKNLELGHYDEGDTATNMCLGKEKKQESETFFISQTNYNYTSLHFGNLTIYRFRLTCSCEGIKLGESCSEFLPMNKQGWAGYMGTLSNSYFIPRYN